VCNHDTSSPSSSSSSRLSLEVEGGRCVYLSVCLSNLTDRCWSVCFGQCSLFPSRETIHPPFLLPVHVDRSPSLRIFAIASLFHFENAKKSQSINRSDGFFSFCGFFVCPSLLPSRRLASSLSLSLSLSLSRLHDFLPVASAWGGCVFVSFSFGML